MSEGNFRRARAFRTVQRSERNCPTRPQPRSDAPKRAIPHAPLTIPLFQTIPPTLPNRSILVELKHEP